MGIAHAPRGVPQIEVSFNIDTNSKKSIRIESSKGRLSQSEIDEMLKNEQIYQAEDEERFKIVDGKNKFENYVYQLKNTLNDDNQLKSYNVSENEKEELLKKVDEYISWLDELDTSSNLFNGDNDLVSQFESKQKELASMWNSIVTRGNGGNASETSAASADDSAYTGPKIDEVD